MRKTEIALILIFHFFLTNNNNTGAHQPRFGVSNDVLQPGSIILGNAGIRYKYLATCAAHCLPTSSYFYNHVLIKALSKIILLKFHILLYILLNIFFIFFSSPKAQPPPKQLPLYHNMCPPHSSCLRTQHKMSMGRQSAH